MKIISRAEAKARGMRHYFTGKSCCRGHIAKRFVSIQACVECSRLTTNDWGKRNRDKRAAYYRRYRRENPEKYKAQCKRHYERTKQVYIARSRRWAENNKEWVMKYQREYARKSAKALKIVRALGIEL